MRRSQLDGQQGQILVMASAVLVFLFVPLAIFVVDTGLVISSYSQLGETLQVSAEDGASMIDQDAYRASGGKTVVLDEKAARAMAERSLQESRMPGLKSPSVTFSGNTVSVSAQDEVTLMVVGTATLKETRSADFVVGL